MRNWRRIGLSAIAFAAVLLTILPIPTVGQKATAKKYNVLFLSPVSLFLYLRFLKSASKPARLLATTERLQLVFFAYKYCFN